MKIRSFLATVCLGVSLMAGQVAAEDLAGGAAPEAITEKKLELSRELAEVMGIESMVSQMTRTMLDSFDPFRGKVLSEQQRAMFERLKGSLARGMERVAPELVETTHRIQAEIFTEQELRDVIEFYRSPSGRSFLVKSKASMAQSFAVVAEVMPRYVTYAEEDYCSQTKCGDGERAMFDAMMKGVVASMGSSSVGQ